MPYNLIKVAGGWKVRSKDTGKMHSDKPMNRAAAEAQMRALYAAMGDEAKPKGKKK